MAETVYSREQVEQWQEKLEQIAERPRTTFTKRQVVEALIDTIEKALETRSYDEVAKALEADGLEISAGSLKQYVSKFRRSHKAAAGTAGRKRSAKAKKASSNKSSPGRETADEVEQIAAILKEASPRKSKRFIEMDEDL